MPRLVFRVNGKLDVKERLSRMNSQIKGKGTAVVSLLILSCLALQGLAMITNLPRRISILEPLRAWRSPTLWPFLDYDMYMQAHRPGDELARLKLVAIRPDGSEAVLSAEDFGLDRWLFRRFVRALVRERRAEAQKYISLYQNRHDRPIAIRIEDSPLVLTPAGLVPGPSRVVKQVRVDRLYEENR